MERVYFDYNATAPLRPEVRAAMIEALGLTGNPSSVHGFGRAARQVVERARAAVAALAGVGPAEVVFTAGGTEADNLALNGWPGACRLVSALEHPAVQAAAPEAGAIPVTPSGVVDLAALERLLSRAAALEPERRRLVSVMLVNNETGVIQPLAEIARLAHRFGALVHCDAVQAAGRVPLVRAELGADLISLSAHKLGGPQGVGALIVAEGLELAPLLRGGGQERRRRAGTENVAGLAGFGAAAALVAEALADQPRQAALRDQLEQRLTAATPSLQIFGVQAPRVANTSCVAVPGVRAETLVMALDLAGIAVSAGSACSSGKVTPSPVLLAMGASPELAAGAIRLSLGWATQPEEIDYLAATWPPLLARMLP